MNLVKVSRFCAHVLLLQRHVTYIKRTLLLSRVTGFKRTEGKKYLTNNIKTLISFAVSYFSNDTKERQKIEDYKQRNCRNNYSVAFDIMML